MEIVDYNGEGKWLKDEILRRYSQYCKEQEVSEPLDLRPRELVSGEKKWIYPVMERVIEGIEKGDAACKRLGIEFIEEDGKFPFGKILKSNTARALRRVALTPDEQERVRKRLVNMLLTGNVPHEYKQYVRLLKKVGAGNHWDEIERQINRSNDYVMRYYRYLKNA
jgi:hypothetical protein